jgi:hypothetical protein
MPRENEPARSGGFFRRVLTPPVLTASAVCVMIGVAVGFYVAPRGPGQPGAPASASSSAVVGPSSAVGQRGSFSQAIQLGAACKWAYPKEATGRFSGSLFSIVCLGAGGEILGGFTGTRSLNAWCSDPSHTHGYTETQPELIGAVWYCAGTGSASSSAPSSQVPRGSSAPSPSLAASAAASPVPTRPGPGQGPQSVVIPLGAACEWAYPGQASGATQGSGYSIVCPGTNGQVLGGFSGAHSLNAWCADPSHTDNASLPNPALVRDIWVCTT